MSIEISIEEYITSLFERFCETELEGGVQFIIVASGYPSDAAKGISVIFEVGNKYGGDSVRSNNLARSLAIFIDRQKEKKSLESSIVPRLSRAAILYSPSQPEE